MSFAYILCAGLFAPACGGEGSLTIELKLPENEGLSPASGDRVAEVALVTWTEGAPRRRETRSLTERGAPLAIGSLEAGSEVTLAVELRSQTERLVGYGRTLAPVTIGGGGKTRLEIEMRRPFAYVPGGGAVDLGDGPRSLTPTLATFDASVDPPPLGAGPAPDYRGVIPVSFEPHAAATTRDGRELLLAGEDASGGRLILIATETHEPIPGASVPLPGAPADVAVSGDHRFALVSHGGADDGVSIIDLDRARSGDASAASFVAFDAPVGGVYTAPGAPRVAYVLLERARSLSCESLPPSTIVELNPASPEETALTVAYGGPIHDLALPPDGASILVADGCRGGVFRAAPGGGPPEELLALARVSAIAQLDGRLWAAGPQAPGDGSAPRTSLASIELGGGSETRFDLPESLALAVIDHEQLSGELQQKLPAESLRVLEIAVAPGGRQVALLAEARFHADELIVEGFVPAFPPFDLLTYEYFLVDAGSGGVTQRVRTLCELREIEPESYVYSGWQCDSASSQDALAADEEYVPRGLAFLYGDR